MPHPPYPPRRRTSARSTRSLSRRIGNSLMGSFLNQLSAAMLVAYLFLAMFLHHRFGVPESWLWVVGAVFLIVLVFARERLFRGFARRRRRD